MTEPSESIRAIFRIESPRLIGRLARAFRDVALAEDLAQEAFISALERWPRDGVPDDPGAWLMTTAKRRGLDRHRHEAQREDKRSALETHETERRTRTLAELEAVLDDEVGDDVLSLMLVACHPVLSREARVALTLRLLGGLTTVEIARALLAPEPTVAQRIVRAKRTLEKAQPVFEVPRGDELIARVGDVLEVLYLIFNEGYTATSGQDLIRPALCDEALRLGRVLVARVPEDSEALGLLALMELQASRQAARTTPSGEPVRLLEQSRSRWNRAAITRGLEAMARAYEHTTSAGPYLLQAAIASCHARATQADETDWAQIARLYGTLAERTGSPIVELNRAVAVGMADGPAAGLALVDALRDEPALAGYHLLPSVRGELLEKLGRIDEARAEFERAAELTENAKEREFLKARARRR